MRSYRSEDEEDELEEDEEDDGSSIEEEEEFEAAQGQSSSAVEHHDHATAGVDLGPVAGAESVPAYSQPGKGSSIEIGANGFAVSNWSL
jgi:hypothetical protein